MPRFNDGRYSRWEDALIAQSRIHSWYSTPAGRRYLIAFFVDMNLKHSPEARIDPRLLGGIQAETLMEAEPVYVSADVTDLVDHARHDFRPEPIRANDPFLRSGFALFPRPLFISDAPVTEEQPMRSPTGEIPIRAMAWTCRHSEDFTIGAHWISYYADFGDEADAGFGERYEALAEAARAQGHPPLSLVHQFQWSWGTNPSADPANLDLAPGDTREEAHSRAVMQAQLIQTFWRIGSQLVAAKERPTRQMRREALRRGIRGEEVTVIRLRRTRPDNHEADGDRRLTVRHLVRGYWSTRHFKDGARQVWVRAHIRGDDSLPLRLTTRAWEFVR